MYVDCSRRDKKRCGSIHQRSYHQRWRATLHHHLRRCQSLAGFRRIRAYDQRHQRSGAVHWRNLSMALHLCASHRLRLMGVRSGLWSCFDAAETTYWSNLGIDDSESPLDLVRQAWYHHQRYAHHRGRRRSRSMYLSVLPVDGTDGHRRTRAMAELGELCGMARAHQMTDCENHTSARDEIIIVRHV